MKKQTSYKNELWFKENVKLLTLGFLFLIIKIPFYYLVLANI